MNFLLYCCFSARFRATFQSNFTFLSKYCAHYIQPQWEIKERNYHSVSLNNMSNYCLHGNQIHSRVSNISVDSNSMNQKLNRNDQSWFNRFKLKSSPNIEKLTRKNQSVSLYGLNRRTPKRKFNSFHSLNDSHSTIEQFPNRKNSSSWKEIIDVTV